MYEFKHCTILSRMYPSILVHINRTVYSYNCDCAYTCIDLAKPPEFVVAAFEKKLRARRHSVGDSDSEAEEFPQEEDVPPPVFVVPLAEVVRVPEGGDSVLEALVRSESALHVRWYKNGLLVKRRSSPRFEGSLRELSASQIEHMQAGLTPPLFHLQLRVHTAIPGDSAWYTVSATNTGGREVCSGRLSVLPFGEIDTTSYVSPETLSILSRLRFGSRIAFQK